MHKPGAPNARLIHNIRVSLLMTSHGILVFPRCTSAFRENLLAARTAPRSQSNGAVAQGKAVRRGFRALWRLECSPLHPPAGEEEGPGLQYWALPPGVKNDWLSRRMDGSTTPRVDT